MVITFSIIVALLAGCTKNLEEEKPLQGIGDSLDHDLPEEVDVVAQTMAVDPAQFHFVGDWWSDTEIVFVEKVDGIYYIKTYDIQTGDIQALYAESSLVVDVFVHPSEKLLLVHTAPDTTAATVKIVSVEGRVLDEIAVSSSEIAIEWNDMDSALILLTAFYEDWTFDVFLYDGKKEQFGLTKIQDPFPKWRGTQKIVNEHFAEHLLEGGELYEYDLVTGEEKPLGLTEVVYFDTYQDHLLTVQILDEHIAHYNIIGESGTASSSWMMPAVSNYSEWVFPEPFWLSETKLLIPATEKGGQLDRLQQSFRIVRIEDGEQEVVGNEGHVTSRLVCSPNGQYCLTGNTLEKLIDVEKEQEMTWLIIPE